MRRDLGLGGYPHTSLAEARQTAFEYRKLARQGGDPTALRRDTTAAVMRALPRNGHQVKHHRALPHADVAAAERSTVPQEFGAGGAVDCAVDAVSVRQEPVGGIDDGVNLLAR